MSENVSSQSVLPEKPAHRTMIDRTITAFLNVWNMDCPQCAEWMRSGLSQLEGVLVVDVFYREGIAAITYDSERIHTDDLLRNIRLTGQTVSHHYGAELIGQGPAVKIVDIQS